jgi:hypothetical protein
VRLHVTVRELEPACRERRGFTLVAHRGANVVRLPRRFGAGTYAVEARTRRGRLLLDVVTRISRTERGLAATRVHRSAACASSVTPPAPSFASLVGAPRMAGPFVKGRQQRGSVEPPRTASAPEPSGRRVPQSPLGTIATFGDAPQPLLPLLYCMLALSIGLLGAAAVPQSVWPAGATAAFVARRRAYLATAGIWLLAVVAAIALFA